MRTVVRLAACVLPVVLACAPSHNTEPAVPDPDLSGMEPPVAKLLGDSRAAVLDAPADGASWGRLGATFDAHGLSSEAAICYTRAAELDPEEFRWPYLLAIVREVQGAEKSELIERLEAAARLRQDYAPLFVRLGLARFRNGDYEAARAALRRTTEIDPRSADAWRGLGQLALALDENEDARKHLERARQLTPSDASIHAALAQALARLGQDEESWRAAERARSLEPREAVRDPLWAREVQALSTSGAFRFSLGVALAKRGKFEEAIDELKLAGEVFPDSYDLHFMLALSYAELGQAEPELEHLRRAVEIAPERLKGRLVLARSLERLGRAAEALLHYRHALRVSPDSADVLLQVGSALARMQRYAEAVEVLHNATTLDPANTDAHRRLGAALERLGRTDESREHYDEATRRAESDRLPEARPAGVPGDRQSQRPEFERIAADLCAGRTPYLGRAEMHELRRSLASRTLSVQERLSVQARLATHLLGFGKVEEAVRLMDEVIALTDSGSVRGPIHELYRLRGVAYLRQAEVQNCVRRHNPDCCIFPLKGGGVHELKRPASLAKQSFEKVLELKPDDLGARWLINLLSMALGEYPGGVPDRHRIPAESFESDYDIGRFRDIAPELGVNRFNLCGGVIVEDFDGDELLDIVTSTFDPYGPLTFYRNDGLGGFVDLSSESRADDQLGGLNSIGADFDNDGDVDVLILRGAWLYDHGRIRNSLLRNDGDGTFTDVTRRAGLAEPAYPTQAAAWGDFDNDGDLDLYVCNESRKEDPRNPVDYPSQLFRNNGDGIFTDIAEQAGVTNNRYCKGVTAGDYDNDGDLDLYLSNIGKNRLYRNNGDGTFSDVAHRAGVTEPHGRSFATWFFDYDNDGWLDLFVVSFETTIADLAADSLGLPYDKKPPRLYRNNGDGTFADVTRQVGLDRPFLPMGANFGDLDNDGYLDIYLTTGDPDYRTLMPNVMLRNDRGRRYQDVTQSGGFGHLQKGHGVAFADLDNDGDQDIYHQLGGFLPGDKFHNVLFENPGHGNHWLIVKLVGTETNRAAFGARVRVVIDTPEGRREIHRAVGSVSSFGGSPNRQEIGLGDATAINRVEVFWPKSGRRQIFENVELDGMIRIREGLDEFERIELPVIDFRRHNARNPL